MKRLLLFLVLCTSINTYSQNNPDLGRLSSLYTKVQAPFEHYLGKQFPEFNIKVSDSRSLSNKDFKNKVVFINFWAEYCKPCITELDGLKQLNTKLIKNPEFLFVSFSLDDDSTIKRMIKKNNLTYKVHHLDKEEYSKLNYNNGIPTSIILDKKGIIRYFVSGGPSEKEHATEYIMTIVYPKIRYLIENK